jgi:YHS domain-containing protein/thiol-disulfide isomerase/thioredoxin
MNKIVKIVPAVLAFALFSQVAHAQQPVHWEVTLESAKRTAAQSNRLVLAYFCAPWCQACRMVEAEVFNQPALASEIEANYVCVKINSDYFPQTKTKYGVTSLPTTVILAPTPQGEVIDTIRNRIEPRQYVGRLNQVAVEVQRRRQVLAQMPAQPPVANPFPVGPVPGVPAAPIGSPVGVAPTGPSLAPAAAVPVLSGGPAMTPPSAGPAISATMPLASPVPPAPLSVAPPMGVAPLQPATAGVTPPSAPPKPGNPPLGFDGFCPVYLSEHLPRKEAWRPGDVRWGVVHRGKTYLFAGPDEQRRFWQDPDRYTPMLSGDDVVLAVEQGRTVAGHCQHSVAFGGRVFLFADEGSLQRFSGNPKFYVERLTQAAQVGARPEQRLR